MFYCDVSRVDTSYTMEPSQIIKIVILLKLSPIFLILVLSILAWKFGKSHAFPTASIIFVSFSGTQPICCSPASVRENTPIPFCEPCAKILRKKTSFPVFPTTFLAPENFDVPLIENRIFWEDLLLPLIGSPGATSKL